MVALGRRAQQSQNFRHLAEVHRAAELSEVVSVAQHHIWPRRPAILDQGDTSQCVGFACEYRLLGAPFSHAPGRVPPAPALYDLATVLDPWPENDHDPRAGTSVLAGVKALIQLGYAESHYDWIYDADTALRWLCGRRADGSYIGGPLVIGVSWYSSMFDADPHGFVAITSTAGVVGGHALEVDEVDHDRGFVGGPNSWGADWGNRGRWRMSLETLDRLLGEDGEAVVIGERPGPRHEEA